jgi:hypothetical protein
VHCSAQFCAQVWRRVVIAAAAASESRFGFDYLLVRIWTILSALVGVLSLGKGALPLVWIYILGFSSGVILCQG